jgi:hypothetical protein
MEVDSMNNYYITGYSNNASATNLTQDGSVVLPSGVQIYLIKYNSVGVAQWCKAFSASSPAVVRVLVDSLDNPIICGFYKSASVITIDGSVTLPITAGSGGQNGLFLIKYNLFY